MYSVRNEDNMERCDIFTSSSCVFLPSLAQDLEERRTFVMQCFSECEYACVFAKEIQLWRREKGTSANISTT